MILILALFSGLMGAQTADMVVTSDATIRRIGTRIPEIHFFRSLCIRECDS